MGRRLDITPGLFSHCLKFKLSEGTSLMLTFRMEMAWGFLAALCGVEVFSPMLKKYKQSV